MSISKRMTVLIAALLVVALMAPAVAAAAAPAPAVDVPRDHWAYDAVNLMISKGYMGVYDTGRFVGDDPVSRYLLAFVVAKLLQDVEAGRTALSEEDMRVVKELSTTLREQLAVVIGRMGELERLAANASAVAASAQDSTARASLESAAKYMDLKLALDKQRAELDQQLKLNAEASDQKLSALYGDLRNQYADLAGTVTASSEEAGARIGAVENSVQSGLAAERDARAQLESNLAVSLDTVKSQQASQALELEAIKSQSVAAQAAAQSAITAQIVAVKADQAAQFEAVSGDIARLTASGAQASSQLAGLQLRMDDLTKSVSANRAWAEAAIAAAREAEESGRTSAIATAIGAESAARAAAIADERAAWGAAIASEATRRGADDAGLDQRLAALELKLTSTAQEAEAAATAVAAVRGEGLEALNQRIDGLSAQFRDELARADAANAAAVVDVSRKLEAESAERAEAIASEATRREADDADLGRRLAALELDLTSTVQEAAAATASEAAEGLDAANERIADLSLRLDEESAARVSLQGELLSTESRLRNEVNAAIDAAVAAELAARKQSIDGLALSQADAEQRVAAELRQLKNADTAQEAAITAVSKSNASLELSLAAALQAEQSARAAADAREADERKEQIAAEIASESSARQREAAAILDELRKTSADLQGDLERKMAEADAAILASMERELESGKARLSSTENDLAQLTEAVRSLESRASAIQAQLDELAKKHGADFTQQRQTLVDLRASLDLLSKQLNDKIAANAAEDARTASRTLEHTMAINKIIDAGNETWAVLEDTIASLDTTDSNVAAIEERLASLERVIQGSVEELKARFADDLTAERWEAEAREIKLQQMIEELQRRVEQLEAGNRASTKPGTSSGAVWGVLGGLAVLAAVVALVATSGAGGSPTP